MTRPPSFYLGADHAGFALKEALKPLLLERQISIEDLSPVLEPGDDYPLVAAQIAKKIQTDEHAQGILVCGTGFGIAMAANRFKGVRAVVATTPEDARASRAHNHANVLVLGGRTLSLNALEGIIDSWLNTAPDPDERHARRVKELDTL